MSCSDANADFNSFISSAICLSQYFWWYASAGVNSDNAAISVTIALPILDSSLFREVSASCSCSWLWNRMSDLYCLDLRVVASWPPQNTSSRS